MKDNDYVFVRNKKKHKKTSNSARTAPKPSQPIVISVEAGQVRPELADKKKTMNETDIDSDNPIPTMQVMSESVCNSKTILQYFHDMATSADIRNNHVTDKHGQEAVELIREQVQDDMGASKKQTASEAQEKTALYANGMIRERLEQTERGNREHWFFLYHPDNAWFPNFYELLKEKPPSSRFCGYTNHLDTAIVFMLAARHCLNESYGQACDIGGELRLVQFHLLVPTHIPILIQDALAIPEGIGDFIIECRCQGGQPLVWLDLPECQKHYAPDVGLWYPPAPGLWDPLRVGLGLVKKPSPRRVLGEKQEKIEDRDDQSNCSLVSIDLRECDVLEGEDADDSPQRGNDEPELLREHSRDRRRHRSHGDRRCKGSRSRSGKARGRSQQKKRGRSRRPKSSGRRDHHATECCVVL